MFFLSLQVAKLTSLKRLKLSVQELIGLQSQRGAWCDHLPGLGLLPQLRNLQVLHIEILSLNTARWLYGVLAEGIPNCRCGMCERIQRDKPAALVFEGYARA